ncbi:ScbA/BarX family gamma-butyrolactone biosynthesis protein [Streptomyces sp. E5N298]|uniref:ScbA/BarX family gamma-butyrolactone biosynthesis protein n=1 Tax=Streptomyces sp. E5N298 TaxID=1851983 RepID=UPI000EF5BF7A|nr:ScbA/BarX family gamma-butyrolactone biosynthesis protein [Streptomyces sp. E5N298]
MTLAEQEPTEAVPAAAELAYQRPMDRVLVHRRAVMEVFVTDAVRRGDDSFAVAVQAPRAHSYYNDHTQRPALIDPLFLLEAARQAVTVVAHQWLDVPYDTSFLISDWTTEFTDLDALRAGVDVPDELVVEITTRDLKRRGARLLAATLECVFVVGGRRAGTSVVAAGYLSRDGYTAHRAKSRGSVPPLSSDRPAIRTGTPVAPALVGRERTENVVLADVARHPDGPTAPTALRALLDVPVRHAAMYDHPLDHVPAMALMEAARQATVLAAGGPAGQRYARAFGATFRRFVELDSPVTVSVTSFAEERLTVDFRQDGESVCTADIEVAALPLPGTDGR